MANYYGTWTLFKREVSRFMKVYLQTVFAPVMSNLLYFAIFGFSLSRAIPDIQGVTYLQFLVPGLIIMGIINNAYQNPSSSIIIMKYQGLIENLLRIPLKRIELLISFAAAGVFRGLLVGVITYLTAIFFVDLPYTSIPIIFASAILIALFFSFLGILVGLWATSFDRNAFIMNFILQPMIFLGGVFYAPSSLPELAGKVSNLNPIIYMTNLLRYGFTGVIEHPIGLSFAVVGISTIILGLACHLLLRSGWRLQN